MQSDNSEENIHRVCDIGDWETFQSLVNDGVDIHSTGLSGWTCLHHASQGIYFLKFHLFPIF